MATLKTSNLDDVMTTVAGHDGSAVTVNGADLQAERVRIVEDHSEDGWHRYQWPVHLHSDDPEEPSTTILKPKEAFVTLVTAWDGAPPLSSPLPSSPLLSAT
eukprot:COSAG06_NODE_22326_length_727_cov_0.724522_1_plen_102_part_00